MGRDAAVDGIGEGGVFFVIGLDDGGGVHAGGGAEGVAADDRVIRRDRGVRRFGDFFAIFLEAGEIFVEQAPEAGVYEHEFPRRVAHAPALRIWGGGGAARARGPGPETTCDSGAPITIAVS